MLYLVFLRRQFSLYFSYISKMCPHCVFVFFAIWLLFPLPVYFRYVASLCVLAVVGFLGSDLTTPGPRCEVFDDDDEVRCELVFIGPESDHWLCLSLTNWLTDSLPFSKLDWCDPGVWRCQLKICWACYCCSCWRWGSCWQQFVTDLGADVWS